MLSPLWIGAALGVVVLIIIGMVVGILALKDRR